MKNILFALLISTSSLAFLSAGSRYELERDYRQDLIKQAPPPDLFEEVPAPPGKGYVWVSGHWSWKMEFRWQPGYWALPPSSYTRWLNGNWDRNPGGWIWIPGRWI